MPAGSSSPEVERIASDVEMGRQQVLVILFIPSHDRDEKDLKTRDLWADAALNLFADLFGGATAFDTYAGIYRDKVRGGAVAPVPRISTKSGPFSPGEWLESLPGSARGY